MRKKIVAGNWKMNTDLTSGIALAEAIVAGTGGTSSERAEVVLCPPYVLLATVAPRLEGTDIALGAQNMYFEREGAFTGEVSAPMLVSVGCSHVIIGHSERRTLFGETDGSVARKTAAAIAEGLVPIVCVGETLEEREAGRVDEVVSRQVDAVLGALADGVGPLVFAYEPVWAIGTGRTATPEQAQEVHAFVRNRVAGTAGGETARELRILYGGSVNAANAADLFARPDIDGGLIGGASLNADAFLSIVRAAG